MQESIQTEGKILGQKEKGLIVRGSSLEIGQRLYRDSWYIPAPLP